MVTVGVTLTLAPLTFPGFHVYVLAPLALNVTELPAQIVDEEAVTVKFGIAFTIKLIVFALVQPDAFVPVTV